MWCSHCRQDVPGIASHENLNAIVCARCGARLSGSHDPDPTRAVSSSPAPPGRSAGEEAADQPLGEVPPVIDLDNWQLEEDLRAAEQAVARLRKAAPGLEPCESPVAEASRSTIDSERQHTHTCHSKPEVLQPHQTLESRRPSRSWIAWSFLTLGTMTFVCGAVLSGLSFARGHGELWNIGLPLVLSGQAGLLLGLIFQLEGLWQSNRATSHTLDELDSQLSELRHTTRLLHSTHRSGSQSFYAHMAEGASPKLLLADLKGQLDMLVVKMSQQERQK